MSWRSGGVYTSSGSTPGSVYVYAGSTGGPSTTVMSYLAGTTAGNAFGRSMVAGDIDRDGRGDLVIAETNRLLIHLGTGSGVSSSASRTLFGGASTVVGMGDFNGDSWLDLTYGALTTQSRFVLGSATGHSTSSAGTLEDDWAQRTYFTDLNPISTTTGPRLKLHVFDDSSTISYGYYTQTLAVDDGYLLPDPSGLFRTGYQGSMRGEQVDFDGDGTTEVWTLYSPSGSTLELRGLDNAEYPTSWSIANIYTQSTPITYYGRLYRPTALDFNNDGFDDIVAATGSSSTMSLQIYTGGASRTGTLTPNITISASLGSSSARPIQSQATLGDVNGDNFDDFSVTTRVNTYVFHGRSGTATITTANSTLPYADHVVGLGDINGDGFDDVAAICDGTPALSYSPCANEISLYHGSATGLVLAQTMTMPLGIYRAYGVVGDFNGNGVPDLAVGSLGVAGGYISVSILEPEAGLFSSSVTTFSSLGASSGDLQGAVLAAADLDGDGADELIVRSTFYSYAVFRGYGDNDGDGVYDYLDCDPADPLVGAAAVSAYTDGDGDGFGTGTATLVCAAGTGTSAVTGDCNDSAATIFPGAPDTPMDGVDSDCDGAELCARDADTDGVRPDATSTVLSADGDCADAGEATSAAPTGDCDDTNSARSPLRAEVADDGIDQDCVAGDLCYIDDDDDGERPYLPAARSSASTSTASTRARRTRPSR
jgi:hypothetical protein